MKIILNYKHGPNQVLSYNPNATSLPTRNEDTDERYSHATIPAELKDEQEYLSRLKVSAHPEFIGSENLFEFI